MATQDALIKVYKDALARNQAGKASLIDTAIIALWDATFLANQRATALQQQLDEALASNRQSAVALTAMTLKMAGVSDNATAH